MALHKRLYRSLLVVMILSLLAPLSIFADEEVNPPPAPVNGVASIDGNVSEWNTTLDFFGNLYTGGITTNPILGRYYLRFDCRQDRRYLFMMVSTANGARFVTSQNHYFDIFNTNLNLWITYVASFTGDNNSPPDFTWEQPFNSNNQLRWEASVQQLNYGVYSRTRVRTFVIDSQGITREIFPSDGEDQIDLFNSGCSLAVDLNSFTATPQSNSVLLEWETANETNNLGFNLYRSTSPDEVGEKLNGELIPSQAPGSGQGANYEFVDDSGVGGTTYYYRLEDVDLDGTATMHGPVNATYPSQPTAITMALFNTEAHDPRWAFNLGALAVGLAGVVGWRWRYRRRSNS